MTIREFLGSFRDKKVCFVGDGNNMANSLIVGCIKMGMDIAIACPKGYEPDAELVKWGYEQGKLTMTEDLKAAAENADVMYTDVWASMGQEGEAQIRRAKFERFTIDRDLMSVAKKNAIVLHCLPAHRGEEISAEVLEAHAKEIFEQAENRLHAQKAVMVRLME